MASPTYPYPSPNPADLSLYGPPDWGTPTDVFDVQMALAPGMSETSTSAQIAKALAYWRSVTPPRVPNPLPGSGNVSVEVVAPPRGTFPQFSQSPPTFWIDAIQIEAGDIASDWAPGGAGKNLLSANQANGGETNLTGFTHNNHATLTQDATTFFQGTGSVKVACAGDEPFFEGVDVELPFAGLTAGAVYAFSAWVLGPPGAVLFFTAQRTDNFQSWYSQPFLCTGAWQRLTTPSLQGGQTSRTWLADQYAIPWLTTLQALVGNPPPNQIHTTYPV